MSFDVFKLTGLSGVFSTKSSEANKTYIKSATQVIENQKNNGKDNITGVKVTEKAAKAAETGIKLFKYVEGYKQERETINKNAEVIKKDDYVPTGIGDK